MKKRASQKRSAPAKIPRMTAPQPIARKATSGEGHVPISAFKTFAGTVPIQDEEEYRLIAEAIPQIVWTARPDGYNDYFNQRWFEYTGMTPEQTYNPITQGWPDYEELPDISLVSHMPTTVHPEDFNRYIRSWKEALRTGKSYEIEYRFRRASDGQYRWHLGRAVPIRDGEGNIIKWFGTCTDIHDQKLAQEQMRNLNRELESKVEERTRELQATQEKDRANLQRLREMIMHLPMGAIALDEKDTILHFNDRFTTLFKLPISQADLIGKSGTELRTIIKAHSIYPQKYLQHLEEMILERKPHMGEELPLKDGRVIARDFVPIFDKDVYRGYLLLYRDITQEKRVDTSKSEFMSLASHQLRTPLTTIRWTLGRLERRLGGKIADQEQHLLREGKRAAIRMADTIDTMLAISRIEAGKVKLDISYVPLCQLVQDLTMEFHEEQKRKRQSIVLKCPEDIEMQTDRKFLQEILMNLLSNALKYTPEKGTIGITVSEETEAIRIDVADSGYGIPMHQQEKIFSKFFRGDNIIHYDTNGTGLGLYLVFLLTRILRGHIGFLSEEGKGTTFTLKLPKNFYTVG
jgi:signal transduction histidine kinase